MNRWISGVAALVASLCFAGASADAQVFYAYGGPAPLVVPAPVVQAPVFAPYGVVTSAYAYPATVGYAPSSVVQMAYSAPAVVVAPAPAVTRIRSGPFNYTQTTRVYGPTYGGPHYSRVHVHSGLFGTTIRERVR